MIGFRTLLATEMRRCLARRAVRVLIGVALLGIVAMAVIAALVIQPEDVARPEPTLARLADLWRPEGEGTIIPPTMLLLVGALMGGAFVVGGEWKAGTMGTLATWEVRRGRLLGARLLACGLLAPAIALLLLVLFVVATLPAVLTVGTTAGFDGAVLGDLAGHLVRSLALIGLVAALGAAIASIGRSSTATLVFVFAYEAVLESTLRGLWPERSRWLLGENVAIWVTGHRLEGAPFERGPVLAGLTLLLYVGAVAVGAVALFRRRDLAGAT